MYCHTALAILALYLCLMSGTFGVRSNQYGKTFVVAMPRALTANNTPGSSNITFSFYSMSFHKFPVNLTSEEELCNYSIIMVGNKELALHSMLDCTGSRLNDSVVTRSAYRAVGTDFFSMWLSVNHGPSSTELMLAVPTEGWGNTYYAVTLRYIPSVLVISLTETKVLIKLRIKSDPGMLDVIKYKNKTYGNNDTIAETLPRRSAFEFINCVNSTKMYGEFTGTEIIGNYPIGVVTGNCLGVTSNSECFVIGKPENETVSPNLVLEYLLPAESYGKTFFILPSFEDPLSTYLVVVAAADGTTLTVTTNTTTFIKIDKQGDSYQINNGAKPYSISSSKPVQVMYIRRSACMPFNSYKGYATMSLLIPTELFLDMYHWTTPYFDDEYRIIHHVILVAPNDSHSNILIDGQLLSVKCDKPAPVLDGNDCFGPPHQFTEDLLCFIICQDDCPQGTWDLNCSKDCSQCLHDCNKYTGECDQCLAGFKNPNRSCSVACEIDEYGHMCKESCTDKCLGEDCIDRIYGTCPIITTFMQYYHYMFLFLPFGILFFLRQYTGMMAGNPWQDFFYPPQR
ncbi:platelet endothelial aggregation receptor 1 [Biomphalaria pfeifferi]|uniref:Platelet endothelial aggregation receptor 1 n=1 Tax=Biomphalaria pfeifferi TaxID=112525 RepID=A0AAD8FF51_BIOPF|nr:platelet endothelial aggregation receptor 1 [Biomphalaria pfeifferi]